MPGTPSMELPPAASSAPQDTIVNVPVLDVVGDELPRRLHVAKSCLQRQLRPQCHCLCVRTIATCFLHVRCHLRRAMYPQSLPATPNRL